MSNLIPVLTVAGSDSSGGAGIQADIKTMMANGVYAMSAVTALTAQNTTGVTAVSESSPEFLEAQLDAVFTDIPPAAIKIGMVSSVPLIRVIGRKLREYHAKHIVVDPVMVATSGARLIQEDAVEALQAELFPLADVITPNIPELELLSGCKITTEENMIHGAELLRAKFSCAVLAKGGHGRMDADDVLVDADGIHWFRGKRIETSNTHGTGCTLSSAIASNLAKGLSLSNSIRQAKDYLTGALAAGLDLGAGSGPLHHSFALQSPYISGKTKEAS